jgi:hypothetical protein
MAQTVIAGACSDPVLAQAAVPPDPVSVARTISQAGNDACSRFCENLLPASVVDPDNGSGEDLSLRLRPADSTSVEQRGAGASGTRKRQPQKGKERNELKLCDDTDEEELGNAAPKSGHGKRRDRQKQARVSREDVQPRGFGRRRAATLHQETVRRAMPVHDDSAHSDSEWDCEGLDDFILSSALDDAKELLGGLQGERKRCSSDERNDFAVAVSAAAHNVGSSAAEFMPDEDLDAIESMRIILGDVEQ